MTEQRDQAIQDQTDRAQYQRDSAVACLVAADLIRGLDAPSEMVKAILAAAAYEIDSRHQTHMDNAELHMERANVLRAAAQASAKGAPYRPVERLGLLTAIRPGQYET